MYDPILWGILGLVLVLLELTDGSKIFFLPFGIASLLNAGLIFFQNSGSFNSMIFLKYWHSPLISLALFAALIAFILRVFSSRLTAHDEHDINKY